MSVRQPDHDRAHRLVSEARTLLTHSYVVVELIALAHARGIPRRRVLQFVEAVHAGDFGRVVHVDEGLHRLAIGLLVDRVDKNWSLCDAVSFLLMRAHSEYDALTTDHHFEQAGFRCLLTP